MCAMAYTVPDLPYAYDALEPHISEEIMRIHHDKHHQAYVDKANAALAGTEWDGLSPEEVLTALDDLPEDLRATVRDNVGGHYNHSLFWSGMRPDGGGQPRGKLLGAIKDAFGNFKVCKDTLRAAAMSQFGSGWAWLVDDGSRVFIVTTSNQESPVSDGLTPLVREPPRGLRRGLAERRRLGGGRAALRRRAAPGHQRRPRAFREHRRCRQGLRRDHDRGCTHAGG
jgi:Fe-Mn family superoxide dismutase